MIKQNFSILIVVSQHFCFMCPFNRHVSELLFEKKIVNKVSYRLHTASAAITQKAQNP